MRRTRACITYLKRTPPYMIKYWLSRPTAPLRLQEVLVRAVLIAMRIIDRPLRKPPQELLAAFWRACRRRRSEEIGDGLVKYGRCPSCSPEQDAGRTMAVPNMNVRTNITRPGLDKAVWTRVTSKAFIKSRLANRPSPDTMSRVKRLRRRSGYGISRTEDRRP